MPTSKSSSLIVAGIDVGGSAKGFHAVALEGGVYLKQYASCDAGAVVDWCREIEVRYIGIDAPCRWSSTGRARAVECELMKANIWCFSTPSREAAEAHPKDHFRWMLNGADLYAALESTHKLANAEFRQTQRPVCFETFPHAIACALAGEIVSAKKKRSIRRALLKGANIDTGKLTNIDQIDAALCALTAHQFALHNFRCYGEVKEGFIVVPRRPLAEVRTCSGRRQGETFKESRSWPRMM